MVQNHMVRGKVMERDAEERVVGTEVTTVDEDGGGEVNADRAVIVALDEDRGIVVETDEA